MLEAICSQESKLSKEINDVVDWISVEERTFNKGIEFYNCKSLIFLQYMTLLQFYKLFKVNSVTLQTGIGLELYKKLIFFKSLLMKLGPLENKLEYQTNKMLKSMDSVAVEVNKVEGKAKT